MGHPVSGSLTEWRQILKDKGFKIKETLSTTNDIAAIGTFAGYDDCIVIIEYSDIAHSVGKVIVGFPEETKWRYLKNQYNKLATMLSEKYGPCEIDRRDFDSPYYDGDGYEMSAIRRNKCTYRTLWKVTDGDIFLAITSEANIILMYVNTSVSQVEEQSKDAKMSNDL